MTLFRGISDSKVEELFIVARTHQMSLERDKDLFVRVAVPVNTSYLVQPSCMNLLQLDESLVTTPAQSLALYMLQTHNFT